MHSLYLYQPDAKTSGGKVTARRKEEGTILCQFIRQGFLLEFIIYMTMLKLVSSFTAEERDELKARWNAAETSYGDTKQRASQPNYSAPTG
jgi:hypothetical protein